MQPGIIVLIVTGILILLFYVVLIAVCYKKCPPDKILVIYGKEMLSRNRLTIINDIISCINIYTFLKEIRLKLTRKKKIICLFILRPSLESKVCTYFFRNNLKRAHPC